MAQRAVLYARVSSDVQAREDRNSLPAQRAAFVRRCTEQGYEPAGEYQDVESGRNVQRKQYQAMLAAARRGEFEVIVVTFLDRFGRNEREILRRVLELEEVGVAVDAINDDTREFIMLSLTAWKAGEESRRIGERTRMAHRHAAARGVPLGRTAYGYRKVYTLGEDGRREGFRLEVEPEAAAVIRDIFEWYVRENLSMRAIAIRLNAQGRLSPEGRQWHVNRVRRVLQRRVYIGDNVWGDVVAPGSHPAIVEREVWEEVQARVARKAALAAGRTQGSPNLLAGLVYCGSCGGRMNGWAPPPQKDGSARRRLYICRAWRQVGTCSINSHDAADVEDRVVEALTVLAGDLAGVEATTAAEVERLRAELDTLERRGEALEALRRRNIAAWHRGTLTDDDLRAANDMVAADEQSVAIATAQAERRLREAEAQRARRSELPARAQRLADLWARMAVTEAKVELQALVERVTLLEGDPEPRLRLL